MKTALAIVCILMLAWTNIVPAQASEASVADVGRSCCHCGRKTGCCGANHSMPESQPVSAAPASSSASQYSLIAPSTPGWTLPGHMAHELSSQFSSTLTTAASAIFARDCARLI